MTSSSFSRGAIRSASGKQPAREEKKQLPAEKKSAPAQKGKAKAGKGGSEYLGRKK